jgi:hypothetical protein
VAGDYGYLVGVEIQGAEEAAYGCEGDVHGVSGLRGDSMLAWSIAGVREG